MKSIPKPSLKAATIFHDCVHNSRNKIAYNSILPQISNAENNLFNLTNIAQSYLLGTRTTVGAGIGNAELIKLYTDKLVPQTGKARIHYDNIIMSANGGICPYCSQGVVKTLDHFLPKKEYPIYSITPVNLVPSCRDCNEEKSNSTPTSEESTHLHPYYDNIESENWLRMELNNSRDLLFSFSIHRPMGCSSVLESRLNSHLRAFDLFNRYSKHAAQMFENKRKIFGDLFNAGRRVSLSAHVQECYETHSIVNKNSWQTAFYKGLFDSDWFCNGEFL